MSGAFEESAAPQRSAATSRHSCSFCLDGRPVAAPASLGSCASLPACLPGGRAGGRGSLSFLLPVLPLD